MLFRSFWAKFAVLKEVVAADSLLWLAVVAVIFSIIGAFYYLRMIKLMYFDKPEDTQAITADLDLKVALSTNSLMVLGLGLLPGGLMALCIAAIAH